MKLLVTGGAGFIGSNFIRYWFKRYPNDQIVNLDSLTYAGHLENLTDISDNPNYRFVKGDICDTDLVNKIVADVDTVVHFAAETHVDRSIKEPGTFVKTNVLGTQTLLHACLNNQGKRFHHVSTDEVFGALDLDSGEMFNEQTPYNPHSPYSASKAASDHLVRAYFDTFGLPITITNCSNNFGPYQDPEKFLSRIITNLLEGRNIPIYGDGKYVRDWLYVTDHCHAIELVTLNGNMGETYCVGGMTESVSNLQLAQKTLKILGLDEDRIEFIKDRPGHDRRYAVDWKKINQELGWKPENDFDIWLEKTVQWYQDNKKWWKELKQKSEAIYKS